MNKTTEALKRVLDYVEQTAQFIPHDLDDEGITVAAILRETLAEQIPEWVDIDDYEEPVTQEPVAWRVHPFDYGIGIEGVYAMTSRLEQINAWLRKRWEVEPLYAAPVDAKAIRAEERQRCIEAIRKAHHKELCDVWDCIEVIKELE